MSRVIPAAVSTIGVVNLLACRCRPPIDPLRPLVYARLDGPLISRFALPSLFLRRTRFLKIDPDNSSRHSSSSDDDDPFPHAVPFGAKDLSQAFAPILPPLHPSDLFLLLSAESNLDLIDECGTYVDYSLLSVRWERRVG
ncbi:hypothetical protein FFLO_00611 [Filobasidium floriforme]|uniref:Uncharacterized protein n=1 Tax=Filobasidium floriforme TaxID=5210 RepID=A0A8K0JVZ5_9TREE|nr:hypothetical protein FFLO_00611 [Filobasidium floriforme]